MGIEGVGSDVENVCCWDLDFALGVVVFVEGEGEDIVIVIESVGVEEVTMRWFSYNQKKWKLLR